MDTPVTSTGPSGLNKNVLIVVLVLLLIFSFLGINILNILGNLIQTIIGVFGTLVSQILSVFGYTTGVIIDKSADVATAAAITGVEIAGGTLNSVGDLLISASQGNINQQAKNQLDQSLSGSGAGIGARQAQPDSTANPIQNPISSNKTQWCLVGEYQGRRGCIEVADQTKCLSGQIFPSQQLCLNPAMFSDTYHPLKSIPE